MAEPGTPEKIEVMAMRHALGLCVTHPDDCRDFREPRDSPRTVLICGDKRITNGVASARKRGNRASEQWKEKYQ